MLLLVIRFKSQILLQKSQKHNIFMQYQYLYHKLLSIAQLAFCWLCIGCSSDNIQVEAPKQTGVLCLHMSSDKDYIKVDTRTIQPLTDWTGFTFTIDDGNGPQPIDFVDGEVIIEAGTYTLSATNADAAGQGYSAPLYSGDTKFTLNPGERKDVTLNLGAPKNAKVTVAFDPSFSGMYTLESLILTDINNHSVPLSSPDYEAYFPAENTTLTYTLKANAIKDTHVQDIHSASGEITISAGCHTVITLKVNPIDSSLIVIKSGDPYKGEFQ